MSARLPNLPLLLRVFLALFACLALGFGNATARESAPTTAAAIENVALSALPAEAAETLAIIKRGGPYPYRRDGIRFGNYEKLLPIRAKNYYSEYTVPTPGLKHRGARRIVAGGNPQASGEYYYTDDHYRSFRRIKE
ncbi:MAG: ribonuclease [Zoogloeaceae bacterium]|nr:ribonuclease [Zoogloeaceae bacterium]